MVSLHMQTACRIQHVPIACFIPNLFLSVRYFSSVSFCSTTFFIHTANGFDAFDKTDMIFRNRNRKKSQFKMHETKGCPMEESTISDDDNFSTKKMVVQFFCLLSLSFKWIETMREHFLCVIWINENVYWLWYSFFCVHCNAIRWRWKMTTK